MDIVLGGYQNIHGDNKQIVLPFKNSDESYFEDTANCIDLVKINQVKLNNQGFFK